MVTTANELKESIDEKKFAKGENEVDVQEWAAEADFGVEKADKYIEAVGRQNRADDKSACKA